MNVSTNIAFYLENYSLNFFNKIEKNKWQSNNITLWLIKTTFE